MIKRTTTKYIFVHASATKPSMDIGVEEIREWHLVEPFYFDDIGYHYVIRRNGIVEFGRSKHLIGAHAIGWNSHSLAICLVGGLSEDGTSDEFNFTAR